MIMGGGIKNPTVPGPNSREYYSLTLGHLLLTEFFDFFHTPLTMIITSNTYIDE